MIVKYHPRFREEKRYILTTVFQDLLGYSLQLEEDASCAHYQILGTEDQRLIVEDHFFVSVPDGANYLFEKYIPKNVAAQSLAGHYITILYGTNEYIQDAGQIKIGADIMAATYFMLSRWEEYVVPTRDAYDRFPMSASTAYREGFHERPIVNEYLDLLQFALHQIGFAKTEKSYQYKVIPTHDVDFVRCWPRKHHRFRTMAGDLFKRKSWEAFNWTIRFPKNRDPFWTFDYLMDLSESHDLTSEFFWLSNNENFPFETEENKQLLQSMLERGHRIGYHPGLGAQVDSAQFQKDKRKLEKVIGYSIDSIRHHFLQCSIPQTFSIWNDDCISKDSTLGYVEASGFRCGICYPFRLYDFLNQRELSVWEHPLIFMDRHLTKQSITTKDAKAYIQKLQNTVSKYQGEFVFLWHNSSFHVPEWQPYQDVYPMLFEN